MALSSDFCLFLIRHREGAFLKPFGFVQWALVPDLGKKVSGGVTAEGVTSEAEAAWCDCPQPLNSAIQFSPRALLWTSLFSK